jgi:hypothetical protein
VCVVGYLKRNLLQCTVKRLNICSRSAFIHSHRRLHVAVLNDRDYRSIAEKCESSVHKVLLSVYGWCERQTDLGRS